MPQIIIKNSVISSIFMRLSLLSKTLLLCLLACFNLYAANSNDSVIHSNTNVRIITLSPHLAELVATAGAIKNLVGVVSYSDFPKEVKKIRNIGDAFKVDFEVISALKPDYVLTWKGGTPMATVNKLKSLNINVVETEIKKLSNIPDLIKLIAELANTQDFANAKIDLFNQTIKELRRQNYHNQSTFIQTFHQPLYTVSSDHWISEAVSLCGYENIFKQLPKMSAPINIESIINKNPQSIVNISIEEDSQWLKWTNLAAVKNKQVITIHPDNLARPSLRILNGIKQLCEMNRISNP